jgi:hypothetical protein
MRLSGAEGAARRAENGNKPLWHSQFRGPLDVASARAISSFASPEGFVIRSRLANDCFACSSVAQR